MESDIVNFEKKYEAGNVCFDGERVLTTVLIKFQTSICVSLKRGNLTGIRILLEASSNLTCCSNSMVKRSSKNQVLYEHILSVLP